MGIAALASHTCDLIQTHITRVWRTGVCPAAEPHVEPPTVDSHAAHATRTAVAQCETASTQTYSRLSADDMCTALTLICYLMGEQFC